jgi:hypothetical protein
MHHIHGGRRRAGAALLTLAAVLAGLTVASPAAADDTQPAVVAGPINPVRGANWTTTMSGVTVSVSDAYQWLNKPGTWTFPNNTRARLTLQPDGNLVVYDTRPNPDVAKWSSRTHGKTSITQLLFQPDGNLVLYTAGYAQAMWSSRSYNKCPSGLRPVLALQSDSNVVIYCHGYVIEGNVIRLAYDPIWTTNTVF